LGFGRSDSAGARRAGAVKTAGFVVIDRFLSLIALAGTTSTTSQGRSGTCLARHVAATVLALVEGGPFGQVRLTSVVEVRHGNGTTDAPSAVARDRADGRPPG
jgi:hypothetical protein